MSSASITLNPNPNGKYYVAGDTISGQVTVETSKSAKTLLQANIRLLAESRIKYDVSNDWKINEKQSYFDFTTKLLSSPVKLAAGEKQVFEFSIKIPLKKRLVNIVPELLIHPTLGSYRLDCSVDFVGKFDGLFSDDVKFSKSFLLGPMTSPDLFSSSSPEPFKGSQDLRGCCGCFSAKCESIVVLEGFPTACFFRGEKTFPLRLKIKPPPGVVPNFINLSLRNQVGGAISGCLLASDCYWEWSQHVDCDPGKAIAIEGEGEGWFCFEIEAKIDFKQREIFTGGGDYFTNCHFWYPEITYSNGQKGTSVFLVIACAMPDSQRLNEEQKKLAKMFVEGKSSEEIEKALKELK